MLRRHWHGARAPACPDQRSGDRGDRVGVVTDPNGVHERVVQLATRLEGGDRRVPDGGDRRLERDDEAVRFEKGFARDRFLLTARHRDDIARLAARSGIEAPGAQ